ncbi:hypothetical protein HPT27_07600 [Permianibacter sp. IMCC34836]|uniref:hypothetical protein n=1 Tax=Permianibacter fluminis TaxID=2738515 RepID=UPI001552464B|nr:hypothetical protein [Permianibacter fluminis]NQD36888.1 hypothetical protein [Permianibacter fluminis]
MSTTGENGGALLSPNGSDRAKPFAVTDVDGADDGGSDWNDRGAASLTGMPAPQGRKKPTKVVEVRK